MRAKTFVWTLLIGLFIIGWGIIPEVRAGCGDINQDGNINILDVIEMIGIKFQYWPQHEDPIPLELGDVDGNHSINILDVMNLINYCLKCDVDCEWMLNCPGYDHNEDPGGCLADESGKRSTILFEVDGTSLNIYHNDAFYNCCLGYYVDYSIWDNGIIARERDNGEPCDCLCYFNLVSTLNNIAPGDYTVSFYGIGGNLLASGNIEID